MRLQNWAWDLGETKRQKTRAQPASCKTKGPGAPSSQRVGPTHCSSTGILRQETLVLELRLRRNVRLLIAPREFASCFLHIKSHFCFQDERKVGLIPHRLGGCLTSHSPKLCQFLSRLRNLNKMSTKQLYFRENSLASCQWQTWRHLADFLFPEVPTHNTSTLFD
jgi:hypothetical protein